MQYCVLCALLCMYMCASAGSACCGDINVGFETVTGLQDVSNVPLH